MSRARVAAVSLALALATTPRVEAERADREEERERAAPTIDEVVSESGVSVELPLGVAEYARDQTARALGWTARRLLSMSWIGFVSRALLWVLVIGVPVVLVWWLLMRSRRADSHARGRAAELEASPLVEPRSGPVDLRGRLDELMRARRHAEALTVLWTYVAERLSGRGLGSYAPEMTNREFVVSVGRSSPEWERTRDLDRFTRRLDRLLYAGTPLTPSEMDGLVRTADELVA